MNHTIIIFILFLSSTIFSQEKAISDTIKLGLPASQELCSVYEKHADWLPDAYVNNAKCACLVIPNSESANRVREVLIQRLDSVSLVVKNRAIAQKKLVVSKELSKRKYKKYVKKELVPIIYSDHKIAYQAGGCDGDPAPLWGWRKIATRKVNSCKLVWFAIRYFGGSCTKRWGKW